MFYHGNVAQTKPGKQIKIKLARTLKVNKKNIKGKVFNLTFLPI